LESAYVQPTPSSDLERAERVAAAARELGIPTALIGAAALAVHNYVRATADIDLGANIGLDELRALARELEALGYRVELNTPDDQDHLGGVIRIWEDEDAEGNRVGQLDVVNFFNVLRPRKHPGGEAIRDAVEVDERSALRCPRLAHVIALKLDAGSFGDKADVVQLLKRNPDADRDQIREVCERFGFGRALEELFVEADR
jgi:hypothetical protein